MICFDDDEDLDLGSGRLGAQDATRDAAARHQEAPEEPQAPGAGAWSSPPWRAWARFLDERLRRAG